MVRQARGGWGWRRAGWAPRGAFAPVTPKILAAGERRGARLQLIEDTAPYSPRGTDPPPLRLLINRVHPVSANARLIQQTLRELFQGHHSIHVLDTDVPAIEAYPRASMQGLPVHRVEYRQPAGRVAPAALETMRQLAAELFPDWQAWFAQVSGRPGGNKRNRMPDHGENA